MDVAAVEAEIDRRFSLWERGEMDRQKTTQLLPLSKVENQTFTINKEEQPSISMILDLGDASVSTQQTQVKRWDHQIVAIAIHDRLQADFTNAAISTHWLHATLDEMDNRRGLLIEVGFSQADREKAQALLMTSLAKLQQHGVNGLEQKTVLSSLAYQRDHWLDTQTEISVQERANSKQQTANSKQQTANSKLQALMSGNITQDPQQQLMALTQFLKESSLFSLNNNIKKLLSISPLYTFGVTNYEAGPLVLAQVSALDKLRQ